MKYPSLKFFDKLNFARIPSEELASYAYALIACKGPASVVSGEWYQMVGTVCSHKIRELCDEINRRLESGDSHDALTLALAVIDGTADFVKKSRKWNNPQDLTQFSDTELIELHSMSKCRYDMRRAKGMEVFTHSYQWRVVNELLGRKGNSALARILQLTEFIEADGYAHNLGMSYNIGEGVKSFTPSDYASERELCSHIYSISRNDTYIFREELIQIADYIQTEIVEIGETANHLELVNAILCTGMPSFDYPVIVKDFEQTIKSLAKSDEKKDIELAPYYYSLWGLTLNSTYLSRFEKTVRQCYLTLASNKHYPDLGIDKEDSASLASALRFLDEYRMNVWIINDKYDVDKVIAKYKTA
ncbi:MAG: hypothetical protein NC548_63075 [Lachnospiraceae bacterium]|nr:hypothetical protein [Lachnospiraceae bacterium]